MKSRFVALIAFAALLQPARAGNTTIAVTGPAGAVQVLIGGAVGGTAQYTTVGVPFSRPAVAVGQISAVGNATVTDSTANFDALNLVGGLYFIDLYQINPRRRLTASVLGTSGDVLSLDQDVTSFFVSGLTYEIHPYQTLESVFGPDSSGQTVLTGGTSSAADEVALFNQATQQYIHYYFNTASQTWVHSADGTPANNTVLAPGGGIFVLRRTPGDVTVLLNGKVETRTSILGVLPQANLLANPLPVALNLNSSQFSTPVGALGVGNGSDQISIFDPVAQDFVTYSFNGTTQQWQQTGSPGGTAVIPAGAAFQVERVNAGDASIRIYPPTDVIDTTDPAFFVGEVALAGGFYYLQFADGTPFGYSNFTYFPYLFHNDLGFEYFIDAGNDAHGAYLYDFKLGVFFYTDPEIWPYLYNFSASAFYYYFPDPNRYGYYLSNPRVFVNMTTQQFVYSY